MTALELFPTRRRRREIAPGAVHVPDWLDEDLQRRLVAEAREWARPPAPMRTIHLPRGGVMSVTCTCLGRWWVPYRYTDVAEDADGAPPKPLPSWLALLGARAVAEAYDDERWLDAYRPDAALINYYAPGTHMGLHRDLEEEGPEPVVSFSVGATCVFRFGNTESRRRPWTDVELRSGDLFVFGLDSRYAYHGVPKLRPGSDRPDLGLRRGRLNVTLRMTRSASPHPREDDHDHPRNPRNPRNP